MVYFHINGIVHAIQCLISQSEFRKKFNVWNDILMLFYRSNQKKGNFSLPRILMLLFIQKNSKVEKFYLKL